MEWEQILHFKGVQRRLCGVKGENHNILVKFDFGYKPILLWEILLLFDALNIEWEQNYRVNY